MDIDNNKAEPNLSDNATRLEGNFSSEPESGETPSQWALEEVTRHFERQSMIDRSLTLKDVPARKPAQRRVQESPGKLEGSRTPQIRNGQSVDNPSQSEAKSHQRDIFAVWRQHACSKNEATNFLQQAARNIDEIDEMEEQLLIAAESGDVLTVRKLIMQGVRVNVSTGSANITPLLIACGQGHVSIVRALIMGGAHVNRADKHGTSPLLVATMQNQIKSDIILSLISAGANVNQTQSDGVTPLMMASACGNTETVRTLLSSGAHVHMMLLGNECTALLLACQGGHRAVASLLLDAGANPTHSPTTGPNAGRSAVDAAGKNGYHEVVSILMKRIHITGVRIESG